jgi:hypothetical protein
LTQAFDQLSHSLFLQLPYGGLGANSASRKSSKHFFYEDTFITMSRKPHPLLRLFWANNTYCIHKPRGISFEKEMVIS